MPAKFWPLVLGGWLVATGALLIIPGVAIPAVIMGIWAILADALLILER